MEKIIIDGMLYNCKNGTSDKLKCLVKDVRKAPALEHENGTAYLEYNNSLQTIKDTKRGVFIDAIFEVF